MMLKLTTLLDNKQHKKQLLCEHGLSFLLQTDNHTILFDTGQTDKFIVNAQKLGIDLAEVDYVVLSHGHYDHTGGLIDFFEYNSTAKVIIHNKAFKQRFSRSSAMIKENGIRWRDQYEKFASRFILLDEDYQLTDDIWILSDIKPQADFEVVNERLVVKENEQFIPDTFTDELILVAKTNNKPAVLCGCAHTGIVNILHQVKERLQFSSFSVVAGGLHLNGANEQQVEHVISGLSAFEVEQWALNHCTGDCAFELFEKAYSERVTYAGAGLVLSM
ncbi:MBL fold metallo-hydrolase [Carboxylicivirga sp. A043]|uniref:MBL fold metallo-hydrolase n=1 Tax=Carboxylicivirga litoralis TaxID=2816963 RepID=UPI0021CAEB5A|nr:MBL fold metallo-hydrolase [Carboxylicivirga sp. A043]MCU4155298.1 MBL fold metallo-hydrolase [Carboxylicivirga sp. A043]